MKKHNWTLTVTPSTTWLKCSDCKNIAAYQNDAERTYQFSRVDCDARMAENAARRLLGRPSERPLAPDNVRMTRL